MADFFTSQLDYIYFLYGLAFLFLGVICFALRHPAQKFLPWHYVGLFGFVHGLNEWADLVAFSVSDTAAYSVFRALLLAGSFLLLVEFGRAGFARLGRRSPGRWILIPLALLPIGGALFDGNAGFAATARYALGLIGCLWAAAAFWLRARSVGAAGRRLRFAALFMALYAIAAGVVVPAGSLLLAPWLNQEAFFAATGVPVQLLRMVLAAALAGAVWAYEQQRFEASPLREKRQRYFQVATAALCATLLVGWVITDRLGAVYQAELARQVDAELSLLAERLAGTTAVTRGLASTMSGSPWLAGTGELQPSARLDSLVDRYSRAGEGFLVYIMDRQGVVVAASNRDTSTGVLGRSYRARPYFQAAMSGTQGGQFAMGMTTGLPGFYASAPVRDGAGRIVGAVVIKKTLDARELGLHHFENGFLVDPGGMVLLGVRSGGPLRLWPAPGEGAATARATLADHPLHHGERLRLGGSTWLVGIHLISTDNWSLVVLQKETITLVSRLFGIAITLLISVLILLASMGLQREIGTEIQLHHKQQRLEELSERLEHQANTDPLTGAFNRLKFNEVLTAETARAIRYGTPLALIMYDIDHFKRINDRYGHQAGDRVLASLTKLVTDNIRISDTLARWGGEEFMIIVPQGGEPEAQSLAEKLRVMIDGADLGPEPITCSFGVVQRHDHDTLESLTARADRALYRAKTAGRNRVESA